MFRPMKMVYGVPNANFINAAFAYAKPGELEPVSSGMHRGAWYAGLKLETSIAEVSFHMTEFLSRTGVYHAVVDYSEMFASFVGNFLDLRGHAEHPCLSPDKDVTYPMGNAMAEAARTEGLAGIVYPSVRHAGGTMPRCSCPARCSGRHPRRCAPLQLERHPNADDR